MILKISLFHNSLCKILNKNRDYKYIPRVIRKGESLKIKHKYWLQDFDSIVKVEELFYINDDIYYTIKDCITGRYAAISVSESSVNYELLKDYNNILDEENIVNNNIGYSGSEIKAWFFYNINDNNSNKYECFFSYLDYYNDKHGINDSKVYYLYADIDESSGKYTRCGVSLKKFQ